MADLAPNDLLTLEVRSIDYVPETERRGGLVHQVQFWFLSNFHVFVVAIGFVGPSLGLSFGWTALAGAIGVAIGTAFQAFHAAQGPEMGLPQMIQSRAQFGRRGVLIPLMATMACLVGYNLVAVILIDQGVTVIWGVSAVWTALAVALVAVAVAVVGHDGVHRFFRLTLWVSLPLLVVLSASALLRPEAIAPAQATGAGGFNLPAFATQITSAASFNITAAPYVSDYTRYLPRRTSRAAVIASVFFGSGGSAVWLIALGGWLATRTGLGDALAAMVAAGDHLAPGLGRWAALASIGGLVATIAMSGYSAMLTAFTLIDGFRPQAPSKRSKAVMIVALAAAWTLAALTLKGDAVSGVNLLLVVLLYGLAPWSAINLIDYFWLRRGRYSLADLFDPSGVYGQWNAHGLAAYAAGFLASLPFFTAPGVWSAPLALALGGVDVGWVVSLAVSALVYLLLARGRSA